MIEYDYKIIRNEEDEVKTYVPDKIPRELPNIVCIKGPNSSGKSTLLNILALGFHGLKQKQMDPALKSKLSSLVNSDHQTLEFEYRITNNDGDIVIRSEKDKNGSLSDIKLYEMKEGRQTLITHTNFHNKYNLIYDIPQNPTDRLKELITEIRHIQDTYGSNVHAFRRYLREILRSINDTIDPREISRRESEVENIKKELEKTKQILIENQTLLDKLETYSYSRYIREYTTKSISKQDEIDLLNKKITQKKSSIKKTDKDYKKIMSKANEKKREMENIHIELTEILEAVLPDKEMNRLSIWNNFSYRDIIHDGGVDEDIFIEIDYLLDLLDEEISFQRDSGNLKDAQMYQGLVGFLDAYKLEDIVIPGVDKTVNEFIRILKEELDKSDDILKHTQNLSLAQDKLDDLMKSIVEFEEKIVPNIKKYRKKRSINYNDDEYDDFESDLNYLKEDLEKYNKKFEHYERSYLRKGLDPDNLETIFEEISSDDDIKMYFHYTENNIIDKIKQMTDDVLEQKKDVDQLETHIRLEEEEIDRLKRKEKHEYYDYKKEIEQLYKKTEVLEKQLRQEFKGYIDELIEYPENQIDYAKNEKLKNYYEAVFSYLGKKVGYIKHIDNDYEVKSINIIEDYIYTAEGKKIKLTDMGTGQGQSAYLKGLLSTEDDKKVIALFDEVAMMDTKSLLPIYSKLKELYERDKLLLAIVVQKADEIEVISKT